MYVHTKSALLDYVKTKTGELQTGDQRGDLTGYSTNHISDELNISRNLASQYLNELSKAGELVKVSSRPVYFFHKGVLEESCGFPLQESLYLSIEELFEELEKGQSTKDSFEELIGFRSGLSYEIEQCKAAMNYPPDGLPILITGQEGTGKDYMVRLIHKYASAHRLIEAGKKLTVFPCHRYEDSKRAFAALFGGKDKAGYMEYAKGGILYLQDAHCLSQEIQEHLFQFLNTGCLKQEEKEQGEKINEKLIFSTTQVPETVLLKKLLRRIPVIVRMPLLNERSVEEKEQLIIHFFKGEAKQTGKEVFISSQVFETLIQFNFPGNVEQLKSCIKTSSANAFLDSKVQSEVRVYLYHLPDYLIRTVRIETGSNIEGRNMLRVNGLKRDGMHDTVMGYCNSILEAYQECWNHQIEASVFLNRAYQILDQYSDYLIFEKRFSNIKVTAIEQVLNKVFETMTDQYYIQLPVNFGYVFSRFLYMQMRYCPKKTDSRVNGCLDLLGRNFAKDSMMAAEIAAAIEQSLDISISGINMILLILIMKQYNQSVPMGTIRGIIICHGHSTASSMADVVNKVMGNHLFEAMDMPVDSSVQEIAVRFKKYIQHIPGPNDIILMVDMGSLEDIDALLSSQGDLNLGIMNNVSTKLAIDVGGKIQGGFSMKDILEEASQNHISTYRIVTRRKKRDAIIFVSEAGTIVAKRMTELFHSSLPEQTDLEFLPCDYLQLVHSNYSDEMIENYDVLFISGTIDPQIGTIPFIPMEDIVSFKEIEKINNILSGHLNALQVQIFNQNLLKNFSLQNVVQYLTILNADKVLDLVGEAVDQMQQILGKKFSAKTRIGLNIHISCLIERLVTKSPIEVYTDLDVFTQNSKEFIVTARQAFVKITDHYGVELPVSEIAYIHDYISHDE